MKTSDYRILRIIIFTIALSMLVAGVVLSFLDKAGSAIPTYTAAVLCLIFVFLPKFKRFKGFGVEAELLEEKIREADEVLQRLRAVSVPIAEMLFTIVARMGRIGSMVPRKERYRIMKRIEEELTNIDVSNNKLEEAKRDWHRFNLIDLASPLIKEITIMIDSKLDQKRRMMDKFPKTITQDLYAEHAAQIEDLRAAHNFRDELMEFYKLKDIETLPGTIDDFITNCPLLDEDDKRNIYSRFSEEINDLKYYANNHEFRRLDAWFEEKKISQK